MQPASMAPSCSPVVFTFQKEGRCNVREVVPRTRTLFLPFKKKADATDARQRTHHHRLFLPFKKKADATLCGFYAVPSELFLPFKKKADATSAACERYVSSLFLPFKKKADATTTHALWPPKRCFYLSKRRQMQQRPHPEAHSGVVFTFQKEGRCNHYFELMPIATVVFTFQKEGRCNFRNRSAS